MRAGLGGDLLQPVHGARRGLDQGGIDVADVLDLEEAALGVRALQWFSLARLRHVYHITGSGETAYVFGETAVKTQHSVGLEVLAEKLLTSTAVEAGDVLAPTGRQVRSGQQEAFTYQWPHSSELSAVTRSPISKPLTSSAKPLGAVVS